MKNKASIQKVLIAAEKGDHEEMVKLIGAGLVSENFKVPLLKARNKKDVMSDITKGILEDDDPTLTDVMLDIAIDSYDTFHESNDVFDGKIISGDYVTNDLACFEGEKPNITFLFVDPFKMVREAAIAFTKTLKSIGELNQVDTQKNIFSVNVLPTPIQYDLDPNIIVGESVSDPADDLSEVNEILKVYNETAKTVLSDLSKKYYTTSNEKDAPLEFYILTIERDHESLLELQSVAMILLDKQASLLQAYFPKGD